MTMPRKHHPEVESLDRTLKHRTTEGAAELWASLGGGKIRCDACGHRCVILEGLDGICRVRFNEGGRLRVPRGYVAGLQVDPIEKKPFFHAFPGAVALSFGMLGCDLHCAYCQNWLTSQTLRDTDALGAFRDVSAEEIVAIAKRDGAPAMVSTYNEPLITSEWAVEVFRLAKAEGITCGYVSNGNATGPVLDYLRPWVDLFKVDLKSFRDAAYRKLGGRIEPILETIRGLVARGFWVEVVTLLVPGFNDSEEELSDLTAFLAEVSVDIPWHVTAFHPNYKMTDPRQTRARDLVRAAEIGKAAGLRYVYAGNLPGQVGDLESTACHGCGERLIERYGYHVQRYRITSEGACPSCGVSIPGYWAAGWRIPERGGGLVARLPRRVELPDPPSHGPGSSRE
jgi:pyruvate formate lyase activating enzyme